MYRSTRRTAIVSMALVGLVAWTSALAQGVRVPIFDTSLRSAGMGGASEAVCWGGQGDVWANPALLAYQQGALYEWSSTRILPDLGPDIRLVSRRVMVGHDGIGLMGARTDFDYGESQRTDLSGNVLSTFHPVEYATQAGVGMSASTLVRAFAKVEEGATGPLARTTEWVDLALGGTYKNMSADNIPGYPGGSGLDWGLLARVSPLRRRAVAGVAVDLDLAYGHSVVDASKENGRFTRDGFAAHVAAGLPGSLVRGLPAKWARWLVPSLSPLIRVTAADDGEDFRPAGAGEPSHATRTGAEVTIANVFSLRTGHVTDRELDIDGATTGWSLGFSLGGAIGYRYDRATTPVNSGFPDRPSHGWSAFVDPLALSRLLH